MIIDALGFVFGGQEALSIWRMRDIAVRAET
jgi:hypothetical protein